MRGKKQFPTISKFIKELQFIFVGKTNVLTEAGWRGGDEKRRKMPHTYLGSFSFQQVFYY